MAIKSRISSIALAASAAAVLVLLPAFAQQQVAPGQGSVTKEELAQNFQAEHEIGRRFHIDPNDLPPPKTGPIVADRSMIVPFNGFYEGDQFPAEYKGSLFVALKGSWNLSIPTAYKVVRVPFKEGRPEGWYENFATGFWASGEQRAEVWGRPAALAVAKDGSLLVADDTGGTIWRIAYTGRRDTTGAPAAAPAQKYGAR